MHWFLIIIAMTNGQPSIQSVTPMPSKEACETFAANYEDITVANGAEKPTKYIRVHTNFKCLSDAPKPKP